MIKTLETKAAELPWLWAFDNDYMRLAAVAVVAIGVVLVICLPAVIKAWQGDRENKRKYELENKRLQARISAREQAKRSDKP
jgi:hypothetical protein